MALDRIHLQGNEEARRNQIRQFAAKHAQECEEFIFIGLNADGQLVVDRAFNSPLTVIALLEHTKTDIILELKEMSSGTKKG